MYCCFGAVITISNYCEHATATALKKETAAHPTSGIFKPRIISLFISVVFTWTFVAFLHFGNGHFGAFTPKCANAFNCCIYHLTIEYLECETCLLESIIILENIIYNLGIIREWKNTEWLTLYLYFLILSCFVWNLKLFLFFCAIGQNPKQWAPEAITLDFCHDL